MKLRITQKQLDELTLEQKQNLCDLWIPHLYDVAVATVCVDAAEEKYGQITYVIGGITILKNSNLHLYDSKFLPNEKIRILNEDDDNLESNDSENIDENNGTAKSQCGCGGVEDSFGEEDFFDEDFSFEFQRPDSYSKQECLPLLDIGQMIDILSRKNFGQCNFSLSVETDEDYIEMGKDNSLNQNSYNDNGNSELCDVLWNAIKAVL